MAQPPAWPRDLPTRLGVAALLAAVLLAGLLSLFPITSFDVWWHLRTGKLILDTGSIPSVDPFTYTAAGRPWVTHEWLFEVLLFLLYRLGGVDLLVLVKALLAAVAVGLGAVAALVGPSARERIPAVAVGALLAAPMIAARAFVRPHMATAVLLGATLVLLRLEATTGRRWCRWALAPLFLLWANLHSGFVLGLGLVALAWLGDAVARLLGSPRLPAPVWRERLLILAVAAAATLVNPHGVEAFLYPFRLVGREEVRGSIVELRTVFHPVYRGALFLDALAAAAVAMAILLVASRRRLVWPLLVPGVVFTGLALLSLRGVSELAVLVPALLALHGQALGSRRQVASATGLAVLALAVAGGAAVLAWGQPMGKEPNRRAGLGIHRPNWPTAATRFLAATRPAGETFNLLAYGGCFIHELWPQRRVFIDGRLEVFPPGFLTAYTRLMDTGEGWDNLVERYDIGTAVVDYHAHPELDRGLRSRLRDDRGWVCVFFSDNAVVYARRRADNTGLIERYGTPFDPSLRSTASLETFVATAATAERERAVAAITAIAELAPGESTPSLILGQLLLAGGRVDLAVEPLRRAVFANQSSRPARVALVRALAASGRRAQALEEAEAAARLKPESAEPLLLLADLEHATGRLPAAARVLERAVTFEPASFLAHLRSGVVAAELGRLAEAREHFEEALRLRPDDPAAAQNLRTLRALESARGTTER